MKSNLCARLFLGFGLIFGFACVVLARYEPVAKLQLSAEPQLLAALPVGELTSSFRLEQRVELRRTVVLTPQTSADFVCLDLKLANYGNRRNTGEFLVDVILDGSIFTQKIDAVTVRDNAMRKVCLSGLVAAALFEAESIRIGLRGSSSPSGAAVTAWTTTDLSAGELLGVTAPLSGRSLVFRFSTQPPAGHVPMQVWVLLLLGLVAICAVLLPWLLVVDQPS